MRCVTSTTRGVLVVLLFHMFAGTRNFAIRYCHRTTAYHCYYCNHVRHLLREPCVNLFLPWRCVASTGLRGCVTSSHRWQEEEVAQGGGDSQRRSNRLTYTWCLLDNSFLPLPTTMGQKTRGKEQKSTNKQ